MVKQKKKDKDTLSILELLEEKVDIEKLLAKVPLHEAELIDAALEQPSLILKAGTVRVQAFHERTLYEHRLALTESKAGQRLRSIRSSGGRREHTEGAVKERVQLQPKVKQLQHKLNKAFAKEELAKMLADVFRQRSDAIRVIVNAGKVSVHAKELAYLTSSKKLGKVVRRIRERWDKDDDE